LHYDVRKIHVVIAIAMRRLPPLNALRAFEAAARCLSFSAAAEALCVTHSAVSHQMRQLEDWLGRELFIRHAGGVRLTGAGQSLLQAAGQAFSVLEACCTEIREKHAVDEIVLGAPGSFLANWLIPRLERFEAAFPHLRIRLQTSNTPDELQKQRVDALVCIGRPPWPRQLVATPLFAETIGPVCAPDRASAIRQPGDLAGQTLLHTTSRPQAWAEWAAVHALDAASFTEGRQFDHLPLLLEAAAAGLGVAIAPALLVEREIAQGRIVAPLGFIACGSLFAFCVGAARVRDTGLVHLRDWLLDEAG
jgi:DNA-binding transcriptional LysR family regulator